jgi:hypothetical protein
MSVRSPFHALLFAVYPVLHVAAANPGQVGARSMVLALTGALGGAALLLAALRVAFGSADRAALAFAVLLLALFAYGPLHSVIELELMDASERSSSGLLAERADWIHPILSSLFALATGLGLLIVHRLRSSRLPSIRQALNVASVVLIAMVVLQYATGVSAAAVADATKGATAAPSASTAGPAAKEPASSAAGYLPDFYYVILDGYARADVLREKYGFDNGEFLRALEERGFSVNDSSSANYNWTFLSLASSLNFDYVDQLIGATDPRQTDRSTAYQAVRDNAAARFLRERGYRFLHLRSTWGATLENPYADEAIDCQRTLLVDEFLQTLVDTSWLKVLQSRASGDLARCHLANLATLASMGARPGPKLVFAHFVPPHHPYLFDRDGNVIRHADLSNQFEFQKRLWERKDLYIDQLVFMNGRILAAIDRILAASPRPPVIILQSDHGPNITQGLSGREHRRVRMANFAAYLTPGAPDGLLPSDTAPVNQFRHLFNFYFDAGMEILPVRNFYSPYALPFDWREITGEIQGRGGVAGEVAGGP